MTLRAPTPILAAALTVASLALALALTGGQHARGQAGPTFLVDVDADGNSPSSLDEIDSCREVDQGDEFSVDIVIENVSRLFSWEATITHDHSIIEILEHDVRMFIAQEPNSNPLDASEPLPDVNGRHLLAVGDVSTATESGSGVLARVTFLAVAEGVSEISMPQRDRNNDGRADQGVQLTQAGGVIVGDVNGDNFFDGPVTPGLIAVGEGCDHLTPAPTAPPPVGGGTSPAPGATSGPTPAVGTSEPGDGQPGSAATTTPPGEGAQAGDDGDEPAPTGFANGGGVGGGGNVGPSGASGGDGSGVPFWAIVVLAVAFAMVVTGAAILVYRRLSGPPGV